MSKSAIIKFLLLVFMVNHQFIAQGQIARQKMIGNNIAIFYPEGFQPQLTLPSLALLTEPAETGDVPATWSLKPFFRSANNKQIAEIYPGRNVSLYGTGEVTGPLLRNGHEVTLWNTDNFNYKFDSLRLYQSHPFVMGVRADGSAFGVIADHSYRQRIILRDTIRFESDGPAFRVIILEGKTPQEVMKILGELTGKMQLPPLWALGYQQCRWSYTSAERVMEVATEFRKRQIPCDVIWMDIDYMNGFRVFTFDKTRFPKPAKLNQQLHDIDFKAVYMIDPGVKADNRYSVCKSGTKGSHWILDKNGTPYTGEVWPGPCHFPDFTKPETQEWWASQYHSFMKTGIDGVWNDMNEPAVFKTPDNTMPLDNQHAGGGVLPSGSHARYHNLYGMLMVRSSREGIMTVNPEKRPFILSRSNFLGGQRYAATWTGDNASTWSHLKLSIPMTLTLGLSGQPFNGPDMGGFSDNPSPELFANWVALAPFYPFSRGHACQGTIDKEPWAFGPEVEQVARVALNRRYRLMPYLYTLFFEASQTNMPVMRPLFFADAANEQLRTEQQAFLLGDNIMVVPQWAKNVTHPANFNYQLLLEDETSSMPYQCTMYQRNGSIIPVGNLIQSTAQYRTDSLTLYIAFDSQNKATGMLYTDAGDGYAYQTGQCEVKLVKAELLNQQTVNISIEHTAGNIDASQQKYRIAVLTSSGIRYSGWQQGNQLRFELNTL
jgi:alpha-glucosidase